MPERDEGGVALASRDDVDALVEDVIGLLGQRSTEDLRAIARTSSEARADGWLPQMIREYLDVWRGVSGV